MARIYIAGAGGAPSNNFIRSIREGCPGDYLIGATCVPADIFLADVDERHIVPPATDPRYKSRLLEILRGARPDFLHAQHDYEVRAVSRIRDEIHRLGVKTFLPRPETVEDCVDKGRSYTIWKQKGLPVPDTMLIGTPRDLTAAFDALGPQVWLRATEGGGGKGALPTDNPEFARLWIDRFNGWGHFTAARCLTAQSITWLSLWHEGELLVAQTRRRRSWNFGDRTLSGVTGITGVGETCSIPEVDEIALAAINAIDTAPHGIFGVDMTYDHAGVPNPTEINIGRFFTTHYFFTKAGLNMPKMVRDLVIEGKRPAVAKKINPLPNGLVWIRGMDVEPVLTTTAELEKLEQWLT
ncbi:MAG: carboxylate--amine ligase [Nitrospirota bacterium]